MPELQTVEVKMMQRHSDCDTNAMLLYVFYLLKLKNEDLVLDENFDKNFIAKCFYCGCVNRQSGNNISFFVIQKISFAIFINHILEYHKDDPDLKKTNYMEQIFVDIFTALQKGLRDDMEKKEKVIIYDEKNTSFIKPQRYLNDNDDLKQFIKPFLKLNNQKISKLHKKPDNLPLLYSTVKQKIPEKTDLKVFYTLYDDNQPIIPENIKEKFTFCNRAYRRTVKLCATKEYVNNHIGFPSYMDCRDFDDELFKKFNVFIGLEIQKKKP